MPPFVFFLLLADRNGQQAFLRFDVRTERWERFVPEFGGGRWEPFLSVDWPAPSATILFELNQGPYDRAGAEQS